MHEISAFRFLKWSLSVKLSQGQVQGPPDCPPSEVELTVTLYFNWRYAQWEVNFGKSKKQEIKKA